MSCTVNRITTKTICGDFALPRDGVGRERPWRECESYRQSGQYQVHTIHAEAHCPPQTAGSCCRSRSAAIKPSTVGPEVTAYMTVMQGRRVTWLM